MAIDLNDIVQKTTDTSWIDIKHPITGEDIGTRVLVCSSDSTHHKQLILDKQNSRLFNNTKPGSKGAADTLNAQIINEEALDVLIQCVLDWQGVEENGQSIPHSYDNVKRLFNAAPWLREQVDQFIGDRANFLSF